MHSLRILPERNGTFPEQSKITGPEAPDSFDSLNDVCLLVSMVSFRRLFLEPWLQRNRHLWCSQIIRMLINIALRSRSFISEQKDRFIIFPQRSLSKVDSAPHPQSRDYTGQTLSPTQVLGQLNFAFLADEPK